MFELTVFLILLTVVSAEFIWLINQKPKYTYKNRNRMGRFTRSKKVAKTYRSRLVQVSDDKWILAK